MSFLDIFSAGQARGHTLLRLLCVELLLLSLCNLLRRAILRRWPDMAWLAEVVATFETGFIVYVEVVVFSIANLRTSITIMSVNGFFIFLINSSDYFLRKQICDNEGDESDSNERWTCVQKRMINFINRSVIVIVSIPLIQQIVMVALSHEYKNDELLCLANCEKVDFELFWVGMILETGFTFILEWLYRRTRHCEGIPRDALEELVKIGAISMLSFLGLPITSLYLNPYSAFLFLNVCDIANIASHLTLHVLCPLLGDLGVCLTSPHKSKLQNADTGGMQNFPLPDHGQKDDCKDQNYQSGDVSFLCGLPCNNNSKKIYHVPNWGKVLSRYGSNEGDIYSSSNSAFYRRNRIAPFLGNKLDNCKKDNVYRNSLSSTSENSRASQHKYPKVTKMSTRFSDTSRTAQSRKFKRPSLCYCNPDLTYSRYAQSCHKFKDRNKKRTLTNPRHKGDFSRGSSPAVEEISDEMCDSVLNDILKSKPHSNATKKHNNLKEHDPTFSKATRFNKTCNHRAYHAGYSKKSREIYQDSESSKYDYPYGKEDKERSHKDADFENTFKDKQSRKICDLHSKENVNAESRNKHHHPHRVYLNETFSHNLHSRRQPKHSSRQITRKYDITNNFDNFDDSCKAREISNFPLHGKENIEPSHRRRLCNDFSSREDLTNKNNLTYKKHSFAHQNKCLNHSVKGSYGELPHGEDLSFQSSNRMTMKSREHTSLYDRENHGKKAYCRHRCYANKTQNAKDSKFYKRYPTSEVSSAAHTNNCSSLEQNYLGDVDGDNEELWNDHYIKISGNAFHLKNIVNADGNRWRNYAVDSHKLSDKRLMKDKTNEYLKKSLRVKDFSQKYKNCLKVQKGFDMKDVLYGKYHAFEEHRQKGNSLNHYKRFEGVKGNNLKTINHWDSCWKCPRCPNLHEISESDES